MNHYIYKNKKFAGFTLIELVMVIAILGIITVAGLSQFGTLKKKSAYRVAMQNIRQLSSALQTYSLINENSVNRFDNFDSLIDLDISGVGTGKPWQGTPGTFTWDDVVTQYPGVYNGSYKYLGPTFDKGGGGGSTPEEAAAKRQNAGIPTPLEGKVAIYHLTENDVRAFNEAGFSTYLLHNGTTMQAHGPANRGPACAGSYNDEGFAFVEGGPGLRPDMSAFYPTALREGSPVVILKPLTGAGATAGPNAIYRRFGYDPGFSTNDFVNFSTMTNESIKQKLLKSTGPAGAPTAGAMLVIFGIGPSSTFVTGKSGIGTEPICAYYERNTYRRFLAVFALASGADSATAGDSTVTPVGILDCEGNHYKDGTFTADWSL